MARLLGPTSAYVLSKDSLHATYGKVERARIALLTDVVAPPQTAEDIAAHPELLSDVEVLLSGWGGPRLDRTLLERAPKLRAVFYAAGSVAPIMTADAWHRGLIVTSAAAANAIPVAEYTVSMMLLSLKGAWRLAGEMRARRARPSVDAIAGVYQRVIGLVSLGMVGRAVIERLKGVDLTVLAYDPFLPCAEARRLGVTLTSLGDLFERADVVSIHTPHLRETVNLIRGEHLAAMKHGATFINTARGAVIDEAALIAVASRRPDLQIILDVTQAMPLPGTSPLYGLPNVLLTPHIAGSRGTECLRMGRAMIEELERYVIGEPLRWRVSPASARYTCHESSAP